MIGEKVRLENYKSKMLNISEHIVHQSCQFNEFKRVGENVNINKTSQQYSFIYKHLIYSITEFIIHRGGIYTYHIYRKNLLNVFHYNFHFIVTTFNFRGP